MSHIAVWTNKDDSVRRKHFHSDEVDTSDATYIVESAEPNPPNIDYSYVELEEYYSVDRGFYYVKNNPLDDMALLPAEESKVEELENAGEYDAVRKFIKRLGGEY